jgi:prepilin-type N-terminal cleavage/methylation domain-containing protein
MRRCHHRRLECCGTLDEQFPAVLRKRPLPRKNPETKIPHLRILMRAIKPQQKVKIIIMHKKRAFTLIELLVVIAIIALRRY